MNSKKHLFADAEELYINELCTVDEIASKLNLNFKTILKWRDEGDWEKKRQDYCKSKQSFHEELYEFARKLMKDISIDIENGEKVDPGRMYAFCKVIPMFVKVKDYEDIRAKKEQSDTPKDLSPKTIQRIEEILGISVNEE